MWLSGPGRSRDGHQTHSRTEQGREANWSLKDYLAAILAVASNAGTDSVARQPILYTGFPAIKTITNFDFESARTPATYARGARPGTPARHADGTT
jgi:hypothetical protein